MPHKLFGTRWGHSTSTPSTTRQPPTPPPAHPSTPPPTPPKPPRRRPLPPPPPTALKSPPFKPSHLLPFRRPTPPPKPTAPPATPPKLPRLLTFSRHRTVSPASAASDASFFCVDARSPLPSPSLYGPSYFRGARDSAVLQRRDAAARAVVRKATSVQSMRGRLGSVEEERGRDGAGGHGKRGSEGCCLNCRLRPVLGEERVLCRKCGGGEEREPARRSVDAAQEALASRCYSCLVRPKLDDGLGLCRTCSPIYGGHFVTIDQYPVLMSPVDNAGDRLAALEEVEEPLSAASDFTVSAYMRDSFVARYNC